MISEQFKRDEKVDSVYPHPARLLLQSALAAPFPGERGRIAAGQPG